MSGTRHLDRIDRRILFELMRDATLEQRVLPFGLTFISLKNYTSDEPARRIIRARFQTLALITKAETGPRRNTTSTASKRSPSGSIQMPRKGRTERTPPSTRRIAIGIRTSRAFSLRRDEIGFFRAGTSLARNFN